MSEPAATPSAGPHVAVHVSSDGHCGEPQRWAGLARGALVARGVERGHLDLSFVGRDEIAALNTEHMDADGPTDVLAFPLDAEISAETVGPSAAAETGGPDATDAEAPVLLGDVVICSEVAHANAHIHGRSTDDELALLVVHGVLHILGMDHYDPAERDQMQAAERELLAELHESVVGP